MSDGIYKDDITKGKSDWISYKEKFKQIQIDREADRKHNEDIAKRRLEKKK